MAVPDLVQRVRLLADRAFRPEGTVDRQWARLVMNEDIDHALTDLSPPDCDAVEISGSLHGGRPWRSYHRLSYPDFDLCSSAAPRSFDVVVCEQVLEHVRDPWAAARTLHDLCRPGGHVVVSTPFLIRVHREPDDYWRFTVDGLRLLLEQAGLEPVTLRAWGNRACVRANFRYWVRRRPWQRLRNEEPYPVVVWATARRPAPSPEAEAGPGRG